MGYLTAWWAGIMPRAGKCPRFYFGQNQIWIPILPFKSSLATGGAFDAESRASTEPGTSHSLVSGGIAIAIVVSGIITY
jgi:hypothetical protein